VKRDIFSVEERYFLNDEIPDEYVLLFDPLLKAEDPVPFDISELLPHMEERLATGFPVLVQSLDYMDKPMGYICYFFESYYVTDYAKTANITEMVSLGLGGYITMKYQRYLLKKVEEMYKLDSLTGLYNRLAFQEAFDKMKDDPENKGEPMLVVMADLDRLKKINDTLGHGAGDQAIASVAHALKEACPKEALCVRFGGDEMLAFIPHETDAGGIKEHIEEYLREASRKHGFPISASCGRYVTTIDEDISVERLIFQVDADMYNVKRITHGSDQ
jgi:diguanylate cyclase (GGDEF)-like protein